MFKYEVSNVNSVGLDEFNHQFYMAMDDGVILVVNLYQLSDDDITGLKSVEGYDERQDVFDRLMNAVVYTL